VFVVDQLDRTDLIVICFQNDCSLSKRK
jgi:hypothetical protein